MPYAQKTVFGTSFGNMSPQDEADAAMQRQQMAIQAQNQSSSADAALRMRLAELQSSDNRYNTDANVSENGTFGARSALEQQLAAMQGQNATNIAHINMGPNQEYADIAKQQMLGQQRFQDLDYGEKMREAALRGSVYDQLNGLLGGASGSSAATPGAGSGVLGAGAAGAGGVGGGAVGAGSLGSTAPAISAGATGLPATAGAGGLGGAGGYSTPQMQKLQVLAAILNHGNLPDFAEQDARRTALQLQLAQAQRGAAEEQAKGFIAAGQPDQARSVAAAAGVPVPLQPIQEYLAQNQSLSDPLAGLTKDFVNRDTKVVGWDPTENDISQVLSERNRLAQILTQRGYDPVSARQEATRIISMNLGPNKNDINAGWTQKLMQRLGPQ